MLESVRALLPLRSIVPRDAGTVAPFAVPDPHSALRRFSVYRTASSVFSAALPGVEAAWRRHATNWRPIFPCIPEKTLAAGDLAAPGFRIPVRVDLSQSPEWTDPLSRPMKLRFNATDAGGNVLPLGEADVDENGTASVHARFPVAGTYSVSYRADEFDYEIAKRGRVDVLNGDRGIVAVDANELVALHGKEKFVSLMNSYDGEFRLVALTEDDLLRDELSAAGLRIPVVANDYKSSPFWLPGRRFPETQLEKLKRLKFVAGLPVVGVVTRHLATVKGYDQAGIVPIPTDIFGPPSGTLFGAGMAEALRRRFENFAESLKKPRREFYLDGMTGSRKTYGNDVRFFTENAAARKELFRLINGAKSFIHVANFGFQSDDIGRVLTELLIHRARQGVKVRIIMDALSFGPFPTERGFSWLDEKSVARMREAGIEVVMHRMFDPNNTDIPHPGPFSRRHRKVVIADFAEGGGAPEITAFGGGRILGGLSFSDPIVHDAGFLAKWVGFGWGGYDDLSYTVSGPEVAVMSRKFVEDFRNYGGEIPGEEEPRLITPAPEKTGGTALRSAFHDSYSEQNTHNVVMDYLTDPDAKSVTLVNSFGPTEEIFQAMIDASRAGKKVRYVTGVFYIGYWSLLRNAQRLIDAGVEVVVVPGQLHAKMYSNGSEYAYGNQNLDQWSQHDSEDLQIIESSEPQARALDDYVDSLMRRGYVLNENFLPGEDPERAKDFIRGILDSYRPNAWMWTEHSTWRAAVRVAEFLFRAPFFS